MTGKRRETSENVDLDRLVIGKLGPFPPERMALEPGPTRLAVWIEDETRQVFVVGAAKGRRVDLIGAVA